jgi:electron transfer flavoprotein beta subunit
MNILVYVRQVLSAGELVEIDHVIKRVDDSRASFQPHETDEAAVEEAVRLKESVAAEQRGKGKVTVVCIGPERTERDLQAYLAVGADEAIRVWDDSLVDARLDDAAVATLLVEVAERLSPDWILCGDDITTTMPGYLSEWLQRPVATAVREIEPDGSGLKVRRKLEKSTATVAISAPGIVAVERGHTPRYPTHKDRLIAKRKGITLLGSTEMVNAMRAIAETSTALEVDAITLPKPGKKNYPPSEDGMTRYVGLLLGGLVAGDAGNQVVEDSTERMAEIAVEKVESLGCT